MTEEEYVEDDSKQAAKKVKKSKAAASQENQSASDVFTIQQEAQELDASEVLVKRTRSKKQVDNAQSSKKRKMAIKKLRQASLAAEDDQEEVATSLVTREVLKRKALELAAQILVPADVLLKKTASEDAQAALALSEDLQQLVAFDELLKVAEKKVDGSESATSEADASRGNPDVSNSAKIIEIESGTSSPTSTSDSSDLDDVTLSLLYKNISPSSKQKANTKPFEPKYPAVLKSIGEMSQKRIDIYNKLPINHPLQPPMVEPLNIAPADAEGSDESAGSVSATATTSTQTKT